MLQLCATVLNVMSVAGLKMNCNVNGKTYDKCASPLSGKRYFMRYLTLIRGATRKSVRECNL